MSDVPGQVIGEQAAGRVVLADNLAVLRRLPDASLDLVYIDPPFNTGKRQILQRLKTTRAVDGDRVGFQGLRYRTIRLGESSYVDVHDDYLTFLEERLVEIRRVLKPSGSLYVHVDAVERIPYLAPGLVGPEKAARGKLPTDTWWHTIVPPGGRERTGYPTQKPLGVLRRIVQASSPPGGLVADFFAGSGTTGAACIELGRRFLLVDDNPEAARVMAQRFAGTPAIEYVGIDPSA